MSKYVDWFTDAVSPKPQTEAYILPRMALTFVDPKHADCLKASCHGMAARALLGMKQQNTLKSDDQIVMFGSDLNNTIFHTIITRSDGQVVYDLLSSVEGHTYDAASGKYRSNGFIGGEAQEKFRISAADFLKDYVAKVVTHKPGDFAPTKP